jgi:hypothetical protein
MRTQRACALAFARSASFVEQPGGTRSFGFTELPKENRKSFGSEGDPKPEKPIGFGRHGASEENRQSFGFDGDPNRDERPASAGTRFRPKEPTSFGWHGISGKANRQGFGRTRGPERGTCKGFGQRKPPGELPGLRPQQ